LRILKKGEREIKRAKDKGWDVVFIDQSILLYDSITRHVWAKKGERPVVLTTAPTKRPASLEH
jgi:hypothetical protein